MNEIERRAIEDSVKKRKALVKSMTSGQKPYTAEELRQTATPQVQRINEPLRAAKKLDKISEHFVTPSD